MSMTPIEKEAVINMACGLTEEQLELVLNTIPIEVMCNAIARRYNELNGKLANINNIIGIQN